MSLTINWRNAAVGVGLAVSAAIAPAQAGQVLKDPITGECYTISPGAGETYVPPKARWPIKPSDTPEKLARYKAHIAAEQAKLNARAGVKEPRECPPVPGSGYVPRPAAGGGSNYIAPPPGQQGSGSGRRAFTPIAGGYGGPSVGGGGYTPIVWDRPITGNNLIPRDDTRDDITAKLLKPVDCDEKNHERCLRGDDIIDKKPTREDTPVITSQPPRVDEPSSGFVLGAGALLLGLGLEAGRRRRSANRAKADMHAAQL